MEQSTLHSKNETFTGQMGINTMPENIGSVSKVVVLYIGAALISSFTRESNLYHKQRPEN
jgi:hypothetical protein